jgi:uncharacterized sulfatase
MAHTKPNVLLIILDTLRRDRLSIYGNPRPTSPAFDAFADDHLLFQRAVAPAQWTVPAHTSMFTGIYPGAHGVTQSNSVLNELHPTLAEILRANGYHTTAFCNNPLISVLNHGLTRGFESFHNYATAIPYRPEAVIQRPAARRAFDKWFRPYARKMGNLFAQNDDWFRLALHPVFVPIWTRYINFKGHTADSISDLIAYWKAHQAGGAAQPMFAFVNLMGAHLPYHPPQDWLTKIAPELKGDRRAFAFINQFNADGAGWESPSEQPLEDWQHHALNAFYEAEIAYQDSQLGRLLDFLKTSGTLDDTVVIIAADHGEMHGEHAFFGHAFTVYHELVHVPMAMHIPDIPRSRVDATISTRRLFHTVLDLAQAQTPLDSNDANADVRGLSLLNVITGSERVNDPAFSEAFAPITFVKVVEHRNREIVDALALRETRRSVYEGDYKLMLRGDRVEALYHVSDDPDEQHDLSSAPHMQPIISALRARIDGLIGGQQDDSSISDVDERVMDQLRALGYVE